MRGHPPATRYAQFTLHELGAINFTGRVDATSCYALGSVHSAARIEATRWLSPLRWPYICHALGPYNAVYSSADALYTAHCQLQAWPSPRPYVSHPRSGLSIIITRIFITTTQNPEVKRSRDLYPR